jgi:DNA repair protein RecN (Recombination protein N)
MLREIVIQNYAVIDNLRVEFGPGLNVLSGETGSGKSILVDALSLALGGRASPDVIRTGQERATVTAVFRAEGRAPWKAWLAEYGVASEDENEFILRREVQAGGRSRLLADDQPVTLAALRALAPMLVEIHGQNEQVELLARDAQLALLDQFTGCEDLLEKVGAFHARRRELEREMDALRQSERERLRTIDLLSFQAKELDQARLEPGEDSRLEEEKKVLANMEKLRAAAATAFAQLYEDEGSAVARLAVVERSVAELSRFDPRLSPYLDPLSSTRANLDDLAAFLRGYLDRLEADPRRLEEIEDRLALLDRLKRKYGKTIEEMLASRAEIGRQLEALLHADERREAVEGELQAASADYAKAARQLSGERREAARKLEKQVLAELVQMGMEKARFKVQLTALPEEQGTAAGLDAIEYRISPNPGEDLRPLEKIASGGELSRVMLALKTVVAKARTGRGGASRRASPTFIFDEVDAGIGGRVAESVGERLKRLARDAQVLCVTHLAQIACFADRHLYVEKFERGGRTVTAVKPLDGQKERAAELARMLSGRQITDAVLKHATTMLKQAGT